MSDELSELNQYVGLRYDVVIHYLTACNLEYYEGNYKYRKFFNDYKRNRCVVIDLRNDSPERIEAITIKPKAYLR